MRSDIRRWLEVMVHDASDPQLRDLEPDAYEIASTYPRVVFEDHTMSLATLGLSGQCVLRVSMRY